MCDTRLTIRFDASKHLRKDSPSETEIIFRNRKQCQSKYHIDITRIQFITQRYIAFDEIWRCRR